MKSLTVFFHNIKCLLLINTKWSLYYTGMLTYLQNAVNCISSSSGSLRFFDTCVIFRFSLSVSSKTARSLYKLSNLSELLKFTFTTKIVHSRFQHRSTRGWISLLNNAGTINVRTPKYSSVYTESLSWATFTIYAYLFKHNKRQNAYTNLLQLPLYVFESMKMCNHPNCYRVGSNMGVWIHIIKHGGMRTSSVGPCSSLLYWNNRIISYQIWLIPLDYYIDFVRTISKYVWLQSLLTFKAMFVCWQTKWCHNSISCL